MHPIFSHQPTLAVLRTAAIHACLLLTLSAAGCKSKPADEAEVIRFTATIPPLSFILRELTAGRAEVDTLLKPGASPHTYEPKPSDIMRAQKATALFSVSPILDEWASDLTARDHVRTIELVPEKFRLVSDHDHATGETHAGADQVDPHYWLDPLTVRAMLPALAAKLAGLDPAGSEAYAKNADEFSQKLTALHTEASKALAPVTGASVVLFHPGFQYFLERYGIKTAGLIEPYPGKEPTPKYIESLLKQIEKSGARAIFIEPQLSARPAEIIHRQTSIPMATLDPLGSSDDQTYEELIRFNVEAISGSLMQ